MGQLTVALKNYDMAVDHVTTLADAEEAALVNDYGAILLDRQLPDGDGLTLHSQVAARNDLAVVVLTARGELADRIAGWTPVPTDLSASRLPSKSCWRGCALCCAGRRTCRRKPCGSAGCRSISVTAKPASPAGRSICRAVNFVHGKHLLRRMGRAVTRSALEEAVYGFDDEIQSNALDTRVGCSKMSEAEAEVRTAGHSRHRLSAEERLRHDEVQPHSLQWRLVRRLAGLQAVMLALLVLVDLIAALWGAGRLIALETNRPIDALREDAIVRDGDGSISVRDTPTLATRRAQAPNFWFLVRDCEGHSVSQGRVPLEYASIGDALDGIGQARLGWNMLDGMRPTARMKWIDTPAGNVRS